MQYLGSPWPMRPRTGTQRLIVRPCRTLRSPDQNLQPEECVEGVCNGCWSLQQLLKIWRSGDENKYVLEIWWMVYSSLFTNSPGLNWSTTLLQGSPNYLQQLPGWHRARFKTHYYDMELQEKKCSIKERKTISWYKGCFSWWLDQISRIEFAGALCQFCFNNSSAG